MEAIATEKPYFFTGLSVNPVIRNQSSASTDPSSSKQPDSSSQKDAAPSQKTESGPEGYLQLSPEERALVQELQQRDKEVKAHEQAHIAAGGQYVTGGASYQYKTGPDGQQYAVGGEVSIDTSKVSGDPEATQEKAQTIRQAALAPANPSPQDQQVAAKASQMEMEAQQKLREQEQKEKHSTASAEQKADYQDQAAKHSDHRETYSDHSHSSSSSYVTNAYKANSPQAQIRPAADSSFSKIDVNI